ncbi:MAG: YIP1 family protein [Chlamydiia bacterium]|nr:YIP1 family protein [Chlamydiia bacterium]
MKEKLGINPWLGMWVHPRKTIRALVEYNPNFRLIILCAIYGFQYMLQASQFLALGQTSSLLVIVLAAAILSIPVGYVIFNVMSFFYLLLGRLIKGKGTFKQIRAATYWSSVPLVVSVIVWIFLMVTHGNSLFVPGYEKHLAGVALTVNVVAGIVQIVIGIWGLIIFLHALGEVQGFSAWMALLNVFLAGLAVFILLFLASWGFSALTHVT